MKTTAEVMIEGLDKASCDADLSKPLQELFDECLNFISASSFDV